MGFETAVIASQQGQESNSKLSAFFCIKALFDALSLAASAVMAPAIWLGPGEMKWDVAGRP